MKKLVLHSANAFRFKKWSRKGYAVFATLGKQVQIGRLMSSISQLVCDLNDKAKLNVFEALKIENEEEELCEQDMLELIPLVATTDVECASIVNNNSENITAVNWV